MATLYIVATPIGNLEDITLRALRILKEVDVILCEDTRVTRKLLSHFGISTKTESYHSQSTFSKVEKIMGLLREGKNMALVSDSGTPTISDPGSHLLSLVEEELGENVVIVPIPGPSALIAALSVSAFPASDFVFLGFLPHKKGRETLFKEIAESKRTMVFYESPHRVEKALVSLRKVCGPSRHIAVARELTKMFEEVVRGTTEEAVSYFADNPDKIRGEFVIIVKGGNV